MMLRGTNLALLVASAVSLVGLHGCGSANGSDGSPEDETASSESASSALSDTVHAMTNAGRAVCRDALPLGISKAKDRARKVCLMLQDKTDYAYSIRTVALWEVSQVIAATLAVGRDNVSKANRSNYSRSAFEVIARYRRTSDFAGGLSWDGSSGGMRFYDDNGWIGQDLVKLWHWSGDGNAALDAAKRLWGFELTGDNVGNRNYHGVPSGGMFWNTDKLNRGTVTNGTAAKFGIDLHNAVGGGFLDAPTRWRDWVHANLERTAGDNQMSLRCTNGHSSGLFFDHIKPDGCFSGNSAPENVSGSCPKNCAFANNARPYGPGLWIGVDVELAKLAHTADERNALTERAKLFADASIAHYTLEDLKNDCPAFNAVFFTYLLSLDRYAGTHYKAGVFQHYKDFIINNLDNTGFLARDYSHIEGCDHALLPQSGALQILLDDIFG